MSNLLNCLTRLGLIVLFTACGDAHDSRPSPESNDYHERETLSLLSPEAQNAFANWQGSLVKACDAQQAFQAMGDDHPENGIDGALLLRKNHQSMLFKNDERFAFIGASHGFSGRRTSSYKQINEVNGKGYEIKAEAVREGSECTLSLYGKPVWHGTIVRSFDVGYQWRRHASAVVKTPIPVRKPLGTQNLASVSSTPIFSLIDKLMAPNDSSAKLIGEQLGLN